jgi:hypothetical protein
MKSPNRKKQPSHTGKKNSEKERPIIDEDLKKGGKGISASKGGFRSVKDIKGKKDNN